jgi:exodeoxyribonuclease VII small subunit
MPKTATPKRIDQLTYEAAVSELQRTVQKLEGEPRSLDEAVALFERGQQLVKRCNELLDKADLKVQQLTDRGTQASEES